jgi:hypothetical protein
LLVVRVRVRVTPTAIILLLIEPMEVLIEQGL